jgi:photosystem II stability/assembly factor-like uncharacterized protein
MNIFKYISIFLLTFSTIILPCSSIADPLDYWVTAITPGTDNWYYAVTYGNGKFVTVGAYGTVLTSSDGIVWTPQDSGCTHHLYGVGFGDNTFVAVGGYGTILTSPDGVTWTTRLSGTMHPLSYDLDGVSYGEFVSGLDLKKRFIVVGGHGTILYSDDKGVTWYSPTFYPVNWLFDTIYGSQFVIVGESGTTFYSTDGESWSSGSVTPPITSHILGVAYDGVSTFVAIGESGTFLTSVGGVNWNSGNTGILINYLRGVAYGNGMYVAVGDSGTIIISLDGLNWSGYKYSNTNYELDRVTYGNGSFVVVGGYGTILHDRDSLNPLVKSTSTPSPPVQTIQAVYNTALNGDTIQAMALYFNETLTFNDLSNKSVTLQGGYDSTYSSNPSYTIINGTVTISNGIVIMDKIIIQ